jgi:hypothetical protein
MLCGFSATLSLIGKSLFLILSALERTLWLLHVSHSLVCALKHYDFLLLLCSQKTTLLIAVRVN